MGIHWGCVHAGWWSVTHTCYVYMHMLTIEACMLDHTMRNPCMHHMLTIPTSLYTPTGITPERRAERTRQLAAWVRETLLYLGPLFIKLGQYVFCVVFIRWLCNFSGLLFRAFECHAIVMQCHATHTCVYHANTTRCMRRLFSTRSDLFSSEFVSELSQLQVG